MGFVARSRRKMWFGTEEYATWIPTPNSGADSSPQAWNETGTFLGGDGYAIGSRNSHKQYVYEWPSSSTREDAQLMKSFYEGTYGRGKLYFVEPLIYDTNVLPAKWANPAITCGFEGPSLVPGVDPVELTRADVVGGFFDLDGVQEPLTGALYNLTDAPGTSATFTPVYENLFTNPRLKGDGTWAEVRRNHVVQPLLSESVALWFITAGIAHAPVSGGRMFTFNNDVAPGQGVMSALTNSSVWVPAAPADTIRQAVRVNNTGDVPVSLALRTFSRTSSGAQIGSVPTASVTIQPGAWHLFEQTYVTLAGTGVVTYQLEAGTGGVPAGATIDVRDGWTLTVNQPLVYRFAGSWPNFSVDPDMRQRWLGTPNASESVMEIERVAGLIESNAIAGVSTWEGKPAVRLISTGSELGTALALAFSTASSVTGVGTVSLDAPLQGTLDSRALTLHAGGREASAPNLAGNHPLRVTDGSPTAGQVGIGLTNGATQGNGDVWWYDIGLFEGTYDGPVFSGSDGSVTIDGIPYSTRWVGASDVSVSQAGIWTLDDNITLDDRNSVFIPIPEGMQLNIGANSREVGSDSPGIYLKPITDTPSNDIYKVGQASLSNLFPLVIPAKNGIRGVRMWIGKLGDSGNPSYVAVNFIHARLSPIGKPPTGPSHWIGGQGHAGTRFALPPTYISNTGVGGGQISYAATFKESLI